MSIVHTDNRSNHLRYDDHVTEMGLNGSGSLVLGSEGLGLSQLLDQRKLLAVQAASELPAGTARKKGHELLVAQVQEVIKFNTSVGELLEYTFLLFSVSGHGRAVDRAVKEDRKKTTRDIGNIQGEKTSQNVYRRLRPTRSSEGRKCNQEKDTRDILD